MQHRQNKTHIHLHTECTQNAHTQRTEQNTEQNNMQHIHINTEQENTEQHTDTETNNPAQDNTYTSTENSTYDLHKYSFDLYHEQIYIRNSDTIELYTISK